MSFNFCNNSIPFCVLMSFVQEMFTKIFAKIKAWFFNIARQFHLIFSDEYFIYIKEKFFLVCRELFTLHFIRFFEREVLCAII